jgi:hypothetical protein
VGTGLITSDRSRRGHGAYRSHGHAADMVRTVRTVTPQTWCVGVRTVTPQTWCVGVRTVTPLTW